MKVSYTLSQSLIAANAPVSVDLIISFQAEGSGDRLPRRPLNLSLVLDRSGSMAGSPLRYAIQAAIKLVDYLTPEDLLSVVIYDDEPETIVSPQPVQDRQKLQEQLGRIQARGCTNLSGGWLMGCDRVKANQSHQRLNRVLLLTDGLANVGVTETSTLTRTASDKAEQGIITTTLGFGNSFNEDLLIGMADAAKGSFYFIQSFDEAADVFRIEMESLVSMVTQNLTVTLQPQGGSQVTELLNNYASQTKENGLEVFLGDVYGVENKPLALSVTIPPQAQTGTLQILNLTYQYETVVNDKLEKVSQQIPILITVATDEEAKQVQPDTTVVEQTSQLRIAQIKDEAVSLADGGNYQQAAEKLRQMAQSLKQKALEEFFVIAEEISQLEYYAQRLENRNFDSSIRKEMRDQSYQTRTRDRGDLKLRGTTSGTADNLEAVENPDGGILLKCDRIGGKLRVRVISDGYDPNLNVQFPRSIREEGVTYVVDEITVSADGTFYRASGNIRRLGKPTAKRTTSKQKNLQTANAAGTVADLETTDTVGDGVLIQCVKDGKKIRARVVSDGYDPNYNVRFPRNIREEGFLFVVDGIKEAQGGSYIAMGKIRRFVQSLN